MSWLRRRQTSPLHRHQWSTKAAQQTEVFANGDTSKPPISSYTRVLSVCYCGEQRVKQIDGKWTMEQLQAPDPPLSPQVGTEVTDGWQKLLKDED